MSGVVASSYRVVSPVPWSNTTNAGVSPVGSTQPASGVSSSLTSRGCFASTWPIRCCMSPSTSHTSPSEAKTKPISVRTNASIGLPTSTVMSP